MSDDRIISADEARQFIIGATEGPWEVGVASMWKQGVRVETEMFVRRPGDNVAIAAQVIDPRTEEISESNARLLAAAPDLAASVIALHERLATLDAEVARGIAERETLRRERDEARAIIAGRDTPPTDEEIAVHQAQGGEWLGFRADGPPWRRGAVIADFTYSEEHVRAAHRCARWWALDAEGRPCAWPVVTS